jgi:hypothetical protein
VSETRKSRDQNPPEALAAAVAPGPFLRAAAAIEPDQILPLRADPTVAQHNVSAGVAAVMEYAEHAREHLPHVDLDELRSLPDLALAVIAAAREVDATDEAEARRLLDEAGALRRLLRASAVALAEAGALSPRDAARVRDTRGPFDAGADCLALAALFQRRAGDLEGKTAVAEADVARAAEVGAALRALLRPKAAARKPGPGGMSPVELRDRLWTLLAIRHERLWAVGAYIYGHAVDDHVPALLAPVAGRRPKKRPDAPGDEASSAG